MSRIAIVDYGAGNLLSVERAFRHLDANPVLASTPDAIAKAGRLVLPGVGAFGSCMASLNSCGLTDSVKEFAASGRPLLGICVGLQMLFDESEEFGLHAGLGIIPGRVTRIPSLGADGRPHKVPHIGWNAVTPAADAAWHGTPLSGIQVGISMYFVHSYVGEPTHRRHRLAECDYDGMPLLAVAKMDNVVGCQFHPEKSGEAGLTLLAAFLGDAA
ncbi:MAG: imidazole glycerol phosphate synthase subunit HisH [Rhodospirillales bacterium]|jgi:glutamine amidotransferase